MGAVRVVSDLEEIAGAWDALADRAGADPFQRPGWFRAWWAAFGGRGAPRFVLIGGRGRIDAVAPLILHRGAARSAANVHTPAGGLLAADAAARRALVDALVAFDVRRLELPLLDASGALLGEMEVAARSAGRRVMRSGAGRSPALYLDDLDDPLYALSRRRRKDLRRARRRLEERGDVELTVQRDADGLDEALTQAFAVEARQWKGAAGTAIDRDPALRSFYRAVAHDAAGRGELRLAMLRLDGRLIAFGLGVAGPRPRTAAYALKTGFDPDFAGFSPGHLITAAEVRAALEDGAGRFELLGAPEPHKRMWTGRTVAKVNLVLAPAGPRGAPAALRHRFIRPAGRRLAGLVAPRPPGGDRRPGVPARADLVLHRSPAQAAWRRRAQGRLAILGYHGVADRALFQRHMEVVADVGTPIGPDEAERMLLRGGAAPEHPVLVTFDDGARSVLEHALPVMSHAGIPGMAFVVGGLIGTDAPHWWDEVADLVRAGGSGSTVPPGSAAAAVEALKGMPDDRRRAAIDELRDTAVRPARRARHLDAGELRTLEAGGIAVAGHTLTHPCLTRCADAVVREEIESGAEAVAAATGRARRGWLAYPNGDVDERVAAIAERCGVRVGLRHDDRLARVPAPRPMAVSRLRIDAAASTERLELVLSGLFPGLLRSRGRLRAAPRAVGGALRR